MKKNNQNAVSPNNISIWLDNYDDIFSDFDPRPYHERTLSDDFLVQVKKTNYEVNNEIKELKIFLPQHERNKDKEVVISKRLHMHFKHSYEKYESNRKNFVRKGIFLTVLGMAVMLLASYISSIKSEAFFTHALFVMTEPAGWFLVWVGLESLFYKAKNESSELFLYKKLARSHIFFFPSDNM